MFRFACLVVFCVVGTFLAADGAEYEWMMLERESDYVQVEKTATEQLSKQAVQKRYQRQREDQRLEQRRERRRWEDRRREDRRNEVVSYPALAQCHLEPIGEKVE